MVPVCSNGKTWCPLTKKCETSCNSGFHYDLENKKYNHNYIIRHVINKNVMLYNVLYFRTCGSGEAERYCSIEDTCKDELYCPASKFA